ncbi:CCR4-NOT transcription complex subunit 6-like [Asterias rubens]|uniref:CCR4-NOT transcription complex subunit 6-like n=1 Tax=Asterias rubens TaxID=7604 RepID=UPI001455B89F|nr:CCR4-NOT transcription complex subunit 6-like [Asterias rubens]
MASTRPPVCLQREWAYESHKQPMQTTGEFVILTYNILNQDLCQETKEFGQDDVTNGERHELLMQEIDNHNDADVVCMQEVSCKYYGQTLLPAMKHRGYIGDYIQRPNDRASHDTRPWTDGSATFHKQQRFQLIKKRNGNFRDVFQENARNGVTDDKETMLSLTDSRRSFLFTLFRCHKTKRLLAVGNVHLSFDFFKRMDLISLEVSFAINELIKFSGGLETPHILCGDFNQEPHHPGYQLLHDRCFNHSMTKYVRSFDQSDKETNKTVSLMDIFNDHFTHPSASLRSAYEAILGHELPFSCYEDSSDLYQTPKRDRPSDAVKMMFDAIPSHPKVYRNDPETYGSAKYIATLDYIWFSSDVLQCNGVLKMVDEHLITPFATCPNPSFPSDHLLLKARFDFLTPP